MKTSSLLFFITVLTLASFHQGRLDIKYLLDLSTQTTLFIGFLTTFMGFGLIVLFDLDKPNNSYIRSTLSFFLCFNISLICFNNHTTTLLLAAPQKLTHGGPYCQTESKLVAKKNDKVAPGCGLIKRAFDLGLTKDMGSCGDNINQEALTICELQQPDEPWLHFSARRFNEFMSGTGSNWLRFSFWNKTFDIFLEQVAHTRFLLGNIGHVVEGSPKASHHIFTNLPAPEGSDNDNCLSAYRELSYAVKTNLRDKDINSRILEHIYGQMLFDPHFETAVGFCKEYAIHWDSPIDSCARLAQQPEVFLKSQGIDQQIITVFNRAAERLDSLRLKVSIKSIVSGERPLPPPPKSGISSTDRRPTAYPKEESVMSFQCFIKSEAGSKSATDKAQDFPFRLYKHKFIAKETRFIPEIDPHKTQVVMYRLLAQMLAEDFHYNNPIVADKVEVDPLFFDKTKYPLMSLELLKYTDIFIGNDWLHDRADLLEVYPYYHHLNYFIDQFREEYSTQRTRL
ncbi:MAG: hypothetical protein SGI74_13425 [Oligoflexia bacterium]|nr:hypothetical protein [Oligoflexia bacterium]